MTPLERCLDEQARCREEIANVEALLRAGHPDVEGLVLALAWLRVLERSARRSSSSTAS